MALTDKQSRFLKHIQSLGRLLTDDEAVEYYVENHMRNSPSCYFNASGYYWAKERGKNPRREDYYQDYRWWELKQKAAMWHKNIIGFMVLRGYLKIELPGLESSGFVKFVPQRNNHAS